MNMNKPMNTNIFIIVAVKDELTGVFLQPNFGTNTEEMIRLFRYQIRNTPLWKSNASDFSLYKLATYNQETGEIIPSFEKLINGRAMIEAREVPRDDL